MKVWANTAPLDDLIRDFALQMLRKLQKAPSPTKTASKPDDLGEDHVMANDELNAPPHRNGEEVSAEENMGEPSKDDSTTEVAGQSQPSADDEDLVQTPYLPDRIELPAEKSQVLQHLELLFALSVKVPEYLKE